MAFDFAVISILVGLIRRGNLLNLADLKIERIWMIFVPVALTAVSLYGRSHFHDIWLVTAGPINIVAMLFVIAVLWANRKLAGVYLAVIGSLLNTIVMAANGGKMPTSPWAVMVSGSAAAGKDAIRHVDMSSATHLKFLCNIIPEPKIGPVVLGASSIGDLLMGIGLFILIQATMCPRKPPEEAGRRRIGSTVPNKQPSTRMWTAIGIAAITAVALALRLWGIRWSLPSSLHQLSYHPDEVFQVGSMLDLNPFALLFDPHFYSYPGGYLNLGSAVMRIAGALGVPVFQSQVSAYLVARIVTVVMGTATIPIVYLAAAKVYGRAAGILAALVLAIMPLHVVHSQFATVDVPATLWVAAALLGACVILKTPSRKAVIAAGVVAGLATGTKYNVALVLLPVVLAIIVSEREPGKRKRLGLDVVVSLAAFLAGFLFASPGTLVNPGGYLRGFLYEAHHASSGHGLVFVGRGPGWLDITANSLGYGIGVLMLIMSLVAVGCAVARRTKADWLMLSFLIPYFLMISFSQVRFARYAIPMLPVLAILVGRLASEVWTVLNDNHARALRYGWAIVCTGIIGYTGVYCIAFDGLFSPPDPRDETAIWFNSNVKAGTTIGLATWLGFQVPPFAPRITGLLGIEDPAGSMAESKYSLMANLREAWDPSLPRDKRPQYVVVSDFEYQDPLRLHKPRTRAYFAELDKSYDLVKVFKKDFCAFQVCFGPTENLPHDLKYMAPTVKVYRRK